jgi:IS5 family transposase
LANEAYLERHGKVSRIHRKKPRGKPMPTAVARANAQKSKVRSKVEHVFAHQKVRMGMFVRTIGIARATATITLVNMVYNMQRRCWLNDRPATG